MLKKTMLDYRYGHYALFGLAEDFVSVYDLRTETVSVYFLINVDCELESIAAETLGCVHRWAEVDPFRLRTTVCLLVA